MLVDPLETIGVMILMGPLIATVGGIVYAIITDAFRGLRPQLRISILSRRNAQDDAEKGEARGKKSEVWSYIKELRRRTR
jgi:hypothetical protein